MLIMSSVLVHGSDPGDMSINMTFDEGSGLVSYTWLYYQSANLLRIMSNKF